MQKIQERLKNETEGKTKTRFMVTDKWERKEYIDKMHGTLACDVLKIRLNMWNLKMNYKKNDADLLCPKCLIEEDTTEHVLNYATQR